MACHQIIEASLHDVVRHTFHTKIRNQSWTSPSDRFRFCEDRILKRSEITYTYEFCA